MLIRSKKGSAITEAALVLPAIILTLVILLAAAASYYEDVRILSEKHSRERTDKMVNGCINNGEAEFIRRLDFLSEGII